MSHFLKESYGHASEPGLQWERVTNAPAISYQILCKGTAMKYK